MANKQTFVMYKSWRQVFKSLPAEQTKELICAIFDYQSTGEVDISDSAVSAIFNMFKETMDADSAKYEETCIRNREAVKKRWERNKSVSRNKQSNTSVYERIQVDTKHTDTDSDNDYDYDTDNDYVSDTPNGVSLSVSTDVDTSSVKKASRIPYSEIVDVFNETCKSLPKVERISKQRKQKIKTLYNEYGLQKIFDVFEAAERSDFLSGRSGAWRCNFDWLLNPTNFLKVLEGNYENKTEPITNNPFLQMLLDGEYDDDSGGDDND